MRLNDDIGAEDSKIKKNDYNLSFAQLKTTKRILQGSTSGSALR